ncbi:MAG: hypothetical protein KF819_31820 [Labilithrix sp.]|nr:hypothetical protein [Labilithrix sp.]
MTKARRLPLASLVAALVAAMATPSVAPATPSPPPPSAATAAPPAIDPAARAEAAEIARLDAEALAPATDVRLAPSSRGVLGAWLLAGPFKAGKPALDVAPAGVDEASIASAALGATLGRERDLGPPKKKPAARWAIASSNDGAIDLKTALEGSGAEQIAYATGVLHVERAGRFFLLLGVDDGVKVTVDGKVVLTRDDPRPVRDDDDVVPLDLTAGDHTIVVKLHQRDGAWGLRVRFVDPSLTPPRGAYLRLPGTSADDARALAAKMSAVSIDRGFDGTVDPPRYRPKLTVKLSEGAPRGVPVPVSARLARPSGEALFDVQAGGVPITPAFAGEIVVSLPAIAPWTGTATLETTVAGRVVRSPFVSRPATEQAIAHAERAMAKAPADAPFLLEGSLDSMRHMTRRLVAQIGRGDADAEAQADDARELEALASALERGADPYEGRTGPMRRALRSPIDEQLSEIGLYIPPWYKPSATRKFPLVVGLHGLNGHSMGVLRWLFGGDDPKRDQAWEDRHVGSLPPADAFVITPFGYGNSLYRELGETDVMRAVAWAMRTYPIDPSRVTITGPSMGGIGSAAVPLHRPGVFAGAAPLCGYHSFFVRGDVSGRSLRPWEKYLAEERSNVFWAENGGRLPLWIVHGTKDLPEANSGVLIDRYEQLRFSVKHDHPEAGHNVWQQTYEGLKGLTWLMNRRLDLHPAHVRFKTSRTRWNESAWVKVDELAAESGWGEISAHVRGKSRTITATSSGIAQLTFARDPALLDDGAVTVTIDGQSLAFDEGEALVVAREIDAKGAKRWRKGSIAHAGAFKHGAITGPIRDVFYEPITFVYADDPIEARANEQVARAFARIRYGVSVAYPVMSDTEFFAKGEPVANERALFLVGRTNKVLAALEATAPLPVRVETGAVTVGSERFTGNELGAAFIRPNPARTDRYVVVVAGADVAGTLRAMSLPDLLPDFVVYDERVAPSRGQILLGAGSLRAAGFFTKDWDLPSSTADPFVRSARATKPAEANDPADANGQSPP